MSQDSVSGATTRRAGRRRIKVIRPPSLSLASVLDGLKTLAQYSDLIYTQSLHRIKVRYKHSQLGLLWAILQPLSLMLVYTAIFSLIAKMPSDGAPYAIFVYAALVPWTGFSTAITNATNGMVSQTQLITKVYFPREILPLTYVIAALFDLVVALSLLALFLLYYQIPLTLSAVYVVPIILVLTCFMTAMALFFSATQVWFRDVGLAMPLLLQLWMFATPVVYPLSAVPAHLQKLYVLNPMVGVVENFRIVMLHGGAPDFRSLGVSASISIVVLVASYIYFKRVDATMADII